MPGKGKILMGKAPVKKEMNRTAGTAKRKISQAEEVRFGMKTGKPLTGSASGVKSISLKDAGEALTQGIVTLDKKGLKFAPEGLAMALPIGKLSKAVGALSKAGRVAEAGAVDARLLAKAAGKQTARTGGSTINDVAMRNQSTSVFPRSSATKVRTAPNRILELQGQKRAAEAKAFGRAAAKEVAKKIYPKPKFSRGVKGSAPYMEKLLNPLFKKGRGK